MTLNKAYYSPYPPRVSSTPNRCKHAIEPRDSRDFIEGLVNMNIDQIKSIYKSDLHNHATLGGNRYSLKEAFGLVIPIFPKSQSIRALELYIAEHLQHFIRSRKGFEFLIENTIRTAIDDGVTYLETSICSSHQNYYTDKYIGLITFLERLVNTYHDDITINFDLGIRREWDTSKLTKLVIPCIDTGFFYSLDLTGNELCGSIDRFQPLFKYAKSRGLKLKAHLGEFNNVESVREGVEMLMLDEVQHGISIHTSKEVMRWFYENQIQLNICPTSNILLNRTPSYAEHPAKILYHEGIPITINSDDILLFDSTVSEEYLKLYMSKTFSAEELNNIRLTGLKSQPTFYEDSK